ncbi:MAG: MBL fold metallo-hydrolase, partial [Euryarchaeota archaeon CG01_land_8_20_14_3_00_38_12]
NELKFGSTKIRFTKPLWHGTRGTKLGFVVGVIIENKEKIFFTSDIDGPCIEEYADMVVEEKPEILIIDGPATYLLGYIMSYENLKKSIKNLKKIVEKTDFKTMILDHHLLRDYR